MTPKKTKYFIVNLRIGNDDTPLKDLMGMVEH